MSVKYRLIENEETKKLSEILGTEYKEIIFTEGISFSQDEVQIWKQVVLPISVESIN